MCTMGMPYIPFNLFIKIPNLRIFLEWEDPAGSSGGYVLIT